MPNCAGGIPEVPPPYIATLHWEAWAGGMFEPAAAQAPQNLQFQRCSLLSRTVL